MLSPAHVAEPAVNKTQVRDEILSQLREELEQQIQAAQLARDEAISEESKPENQYDMHSQEAAYLAEGQARLAADIAASIELFEAMPIPPLGAGDRVGVGALVCVDRGGTPSWYFLAPRGGGLELRVDDTSVLVLTPQSPLGRELLGKTVGDPVTLPGGATAPQDRIEAIL